MAQNLIDIVDTVVKIGLGVFISSVSSYLMLSKQQKHDIEKEERFLALKINEEKKLKYVEFLSLSQSLVQSYLRKSCTCDTEEYINYLRIYNEVQILSPDNVRKEAYYLLCAVNEFIVCNKNNPEVELIKRIRKQFDDKLSMFQKIAQLEVTEKRQK